MATDSRPAWLCESCRVREEGNGRVGEVVMDGVTAEILAGVFGCYSGPDSWPGSDRRRGSTIAAALVALGIDLVVDEARNLLPDGADGQGPEIHSGQKAR